jgi:hypothetical protein
MASLVYSASRALVEGFTNPGGTEAFKPTPAYADAIAVILAFVVSIIILSFVGLWLWNYSVVPLFEFARPAKSIFQILGLMVFLSVISP